MSSKKSYNRFFIIFQEEDKGYGMGPDRPPTGYAKVETKNDKSKVTVYVQNLKPFESGECLYRCYLISHQDDRDSTVYLGLMNIDELGRGECTWECSADNAFDSRVPIDKFNGAAIVVDREGVDRVIAPLAGYMSKEKFDWRSKLAALKKNAAHINEEKAEISEEAKKFEAYEKSIEVPAAEETVTQAKADVIAKVETEKKTEAKAQVETAEKVETAAKVAVAEKAEPVEKPETYDKVGAAAKPQTVDKFEKVEAVEKGAETETLEKMATENIHASLREDEVHPNAENVQDDQRHKHKESKCINHQYLSDAKHNFRHIMRKMLEDILADYEKMDKHKELRDCILWKVDMQKCRRDIHKCGIYPCYDLVFYPMMYNPICNYYNYISKHGHYLFGIKYDKDRKVMALLFGIPGMKKACDQPAGGRTGFLKWVSFGPSEDGYWIMMYDPITGAVITQK